MLKNISSVISPDLLWLLASMGHGEDLVLVDRNFPAIKVAKQTSTGRLIELSNPDWCESDSDLIRALASSTRR